ncbi:PDZK1-interacting protein 1 [Clupea harengus]|uniref:PDZK1-interacting protein 1 n=1 Tax=Clupea harengus TaxID=7950 RepID=A0A6P8G6H2_CLUHA|nr:PDZK1-interacting protein 1 [Clupea harengus]
MGRVNLVFWWLLVMLDTVSAQTETTQRGLPNWLTGIVAVAVFLFLVFVVFLVNKAWCSQSRRENKQDAEMSKEYEMTNGSTYETTIDAVRSDIYENTVMNISSDGTEDKVTVM